MIFVLIFVSRDFDLGRDVSCEESTVSPFTGLIYYLYCVLTSSLHFRGTEWTAYSVLMCRKKSLPRLVNVNMLSAECLELWRKLFTGEYGRLLSSVDVICHW